MILLEKIYWEYNKQTRNKILWVCCDATTWFKWVGVIVAVVVVVGSQVGKVLYTMAQYPDSITTITTTTTSTTTTSSQWRGRVGVVAAVMHHHLFPFLLHPFIMPCFMQQLNNLCSFISVFFEKRNYGENKDELSLHTINIYASPLCLSVSVCMSHSR